MRQIFFIACLLFAHQSLWAGGLIIVMPEGTNWNMNNDNTDRFIRHPHDPIIVPPHFRPFPLELRTEKASINIEKQIARTTIEQVFYNPSGNRIEGFFLLPLPKGAVIADFAMQVNGKQLNAELIDANKARQIYEDIVRNLRDPALLEYNGQDLIKVRIFPIEPMSEKKITLSYNQAIVPENNTSEYVYPLNTQKYSIAPIQHLSIEVKLATENDLASLYCPTHQAKIDRKGKHNASVVLDMNQVKPDTDFRLYYNTTNNGIGSDLLTYKPADDDGFFFLTLTPIIPDNSNEAYVEKDITFVIDVSGSMTDGRLDKAKEALRFCINSLNKGDRFNIVRFSTEARTLFEKVMPSSKENIDQAIDFIQKLKPMGGTNIDDALNQALNAHTNTDRPYIVVFITDGKPTVGITEQSELVEKVKKNNNKNTRIFTIGIGEDLNAHLLDKIAEQTRAFRTYIATGEDIEVKISDFYTKISQPALTDLRIGFSRNISAFGIYPHDLPDLFRGSSISIAGRYKNLGNDRATLLLKGKLNGKEQDFSFDINLPNKTHNQHDFVPQLWASRAVGYLLDQIRLNGESKELKDEIIDIAKKYGIVTPYTSYLILEDEAISPSPRPIPVPMPRPTPYPLPIDDVYGRQPSIQLKAEYDNMKRKEGREATRSSSEIQSLNQASNLDQTKQGQQRMNLPNANSDDNNNNDIAQHYKNVKGHAIYKKGNNWIDPKTEKQANQNLKKILFASDAYFELLNKEPQAKDFLALGKNVQFFLNGTTYQIHE